jgi:hypothetical protein
MTGMRALTLWQPWASLLAVGIKRHETRSWRIPPKLLGARIAIHAGSGRAPETMISPELAEICERTFGSGWRTTLPKGRILCTCVLGADLATEEEVDAADADDVASGIWTPGRHAWRIDDVRPVHDSGPVSGKQGLWTWHHDGMIDIEKGEQEP